MAPPTKLRPHLNDLLQKNLELEHVVADLRHQLTQSFAKWADERKSLSMGCDALMASFAKFRARLDVHPSDWVDSEGEVEQNLDTGRQSEETGEVDNVDGTQETEADQASVMGGLREKCNTLAAELQVKERELEESRRKREAAEEELQCVQRSLEAQNEQLQAALQASARPETSNTPLPNRTFADTSIQTGPFQTELEDALEKLTLANQEISRLKQLLQQWQKYGNDWKRDAQSARARVSELERREIDLSAQIKGAEESRAHLETEIQRLTSALANQTTATEHQRATCQGALKRVRDLETMVSPLRAHLSPEQLASFDSGQNQAAPEPLVSTESPRLRPDTDKRSDMIVLKIPYRSSRKPPGEDDTPQDDRQNQTPVDLSISASSVPQTNNTPLSFNPTDFELCIHTCNANPCRNESQSFLWSRKQASLPRHALSSKKHRRCAPECPGYRLLMMPIADAMKEPRRARCRPPSEAELALAAEEASRASSSEQTGERKTGAERGSRREGSGEPEEAEKPEEGSSQEEGGEGQKGGEDSPRKTDLGKRLRSRLTDGEESQRARKLRPRLTGMSKRAGHDD